jgi:tyrosyl-tRNA synthetase
VGKHVTVNQMTARESVRIRLESEHGISFTEFSYMLLQANDYLWLHDNLGCDIQIGGSDQWGNIISGVDLIRRKRQHQVHAFSWPLLTASDGSKLGKTTGARTWLDPVKTSPYQLRQHFLQVADEDLRAQLLTFSLKPVSEIEELLASHEAEPHRRIGQRALAHEITALVHGDDAAAAADQAADVLFGGDPSVASSAALEAVGREVPSSQMTRVQLDDLVGALVAANLAQSKSDARRTLEGSGYRCNGAPIDANTQLSEHALLHGRYLLLQRGKKSHHLVEVFS